MIMIMSIMLMLVMTMMVFSSDFLKMEHKLPETEMAEPL